MAGVEGQGLKAWPGLQGLRFRVPGPQGVEFRVSGSQGWFRVSGPQGLGFRVSGPQGLRSRVSRVQRVSGPQGLEFRVSRPQGLGREANAEMQWQEHEVNNIRCFCCVRSLSL